MSIASSLLGHIFILGAATYVCAVRTTGQAPPLHLFASSFNAGNVLSKDLGRDEKKQLASLLTAGHEKPDMEADLVIVGFQEFHDDGYPMADYIGDEHLWNELSRKRCDTINSNLTELASPPAHALEAKQTVADSLKVMQEELSRALTKFREVMAANQELKTSNEGVERIESAKAWARNASDAASGFRTDILAERKKALDEQLASLTEASDAVLSKASRLPSLGIAEKLEPIQHWTDKVVPMVKSLLPDVWNEDGKRLEAGFLKKIRKINIVEKKLTSEISLGEFKKKIQASRDHLGNALSSKQNELSTRLESDVNRVIEDLKAMEKEQEVSVDRFVHPDDSDLTRWIQGTNNALNKLLGKASVSFDRRKVKTKLFVQKFKSGFHCDKAWWSKKDMHYDTMLYVYANPWSKWTIAPVEWYTSECKQAGEGSRSNTGCSIDNNRGMECGKAVNMMVFQASHSETKDSLRICALNTHLSFEGEAGDRMQNIRDAMEQTERARCDTVVFVGDFNTRMHCLAGAETKPLYARSVNSILNQFCNTASCELGNSKEDEMLHLLNEDVVKCLEKNKDKKMPWIKRTQGNSIKRFGLREAAPVQFPPTYKLVDKSERDKCFGVKQRCFGKEEKCICNESGKAKHNPAWTDRVLMAGKGVRLETTSYERRVPDKIDSDHAIVAAHITVTPQR